nr:neuronal acetylcholine receptor subunit beta-3-like [Danaus plexippus plexippus]
MQLQKSSTYLAVFWITAILFCDEVRTCDEEYQLIRHLMGKYDASVRPVENSSHPLLVTFGVSLHHIIDVEEKDQLLTTNCWITQIWTDHHLRWNVSDFDGINVIRIPYERVWKPDIILYNNADPNYRSAVINTNVIVKNTGEVTWLSHGIYVSVCDINVEQFPFDIQLCTMKWASWTYDGFQVNCSGFSNKQLKLKFTNPQTRDYGGWKSSRNPQRLERPLRRLGREKDCSLTRSASSLASMTASLKEEIVFQCLLLRTMPKLGTPPPYASPCPLVGRRNVDTRAFPPSELDTGTSMSMSMSGMHPHQAESERAVVSLQPLLKLGSYQCDSSEPLLRLRQSFLPLCHEIMLEFISPRSDLARQRTLLVFYVPSESGEKVTLGISALLSMTVFLMTIRDTLPPTEKTPLISLYYGVSTCLVTFSASLSVFTLNISYRGVRGQPVPAIVRELVLQRLARLLCINFDTDVKNDSTVTTGVQVNPRTGSRLKAEILDGPAPASPRFTRNHNHLSELLRNTGLVAVVADRALLAVFVLVTTISTAAILLPQLNNLHVGNTPLKPPS